MNWKRAGAILVTLGVTATVGYVGYSYIVSAKSNHISAFLDNCKDSDFVKNLSEAEKDLAVKNSNNITKKELVKLTEFCEKDILTEEEAKEFDKIVKKLKLNKDEK